MFMCTSGMMFIAKLVPIPIIYVSGFPNKFKMAAKKSISCEEIIAVIQQDENENEDQRTPVDPQEVIASAVRELRALRGELSNFVAFEEEVSQTLTSLFAKWHKDQPISDRILRSTTGVGSLIAEEVVQWIKVIHRRLSSAMKARNPWSIYFTRNMSTAVFAALKQAVVKSRSAYGISAEQTDKEEIFSFTNMRRALRDLEKLSGISRSEIVSYFSKECKGNRKGKITVVITEEKPFKVKYRKRQRDVIIECHYSFENEFGYVFS